MGTYTREVSASKTSPATAAPPFQAHGLTATNNSTAQVTITDDLGGRFVMAPGATPTVGYRSSPSLWTVTAVADGPGSVALTWTTDYLPGDVTPTVSQSTGGNQFTAYIGLGVTGASAPFVDVPIPAGDEALIFLEPVIVPAGGLALVLLTEFPLPDGSLQSVQFNAFTIPAAWPPGQFFTVSFGKGRPWPLGTIVEVSGPNSGPNWELFVYGSVR